MSCIDDSDISIRYQALDLCVAMVTSANLAPVVDRLLRQLSTKSGVTSGEPFDNTTSSAGVKPSADSDGEDPEEVLRPAAPKPEHTLVLPEDYMINVICKILDMCSQGTYANVVDFDWYISVLGQLATLVPPSNPYNASPGQGPESTPYNTAISIGSELRNVAVRVKSVRPAATHAAERLISSMRQESTSPSPDNGTTGVLLSAVWIVGEYAELLGNQEGMLECLLNPSTLRLPPAVVSMYLQAIPKIFSVMVQSGNRMWGSERKTMVSLLLARMVHFLEPLSAHPSLEVQERAVECLELMRLAVEAVAAPDGADQTPPLFLTSVIPSLFAGPELNPVAPGAQRKVPLLNTVDLDAPLHHDLLGLLHISKIDILVGSDIEDETDIFYKKGQSIDVEQHSQAESTLGPKPEATASQTSIGQASDDRGTAARNRTGRRERYKDDPFYIANEDSSSGTSTPFHNILKISNGVDLDIDAIPIMNLDLGVQSGPTTSVDDDQSTKKRRRQQKKVEIATDENFDSAGPDIYPVPTTAIGNTDSAGAQFKSEFVKKSLLQVDSSSLRDFALEVGPGNGSGNASQYRKRGVEEAEMAEALKEVERLRLEMQRAAERINAGEGVPPEGTLVKKRTKKKKPNDEAAVPKKGKEKVQRSQLQLGDSQSTNEEQMAKKKNRRKKPRSIK